MAVEDLTASNIAMEEDQKIEEANKKKSKVDVAKVEADIKANKDLAAKVSNLWHLLHAVYKTSFHMYTLTEVEPLPLDVPCMVYITPDHQLTVLNV
jgi:hypothetical protein